MQIGRKIYYDKTTGNIIQECGEREGSVIQTSLEFDFNTYPSLFGRVKDTVGVIQLPYGQDSDKFGIYNYSIDTTTKLIIWGDLIIVTPPIQGKTEIEVNTERINAMENALFGLMFPM